MIEWQLNQTICGLAELADHRSADITRVVSILDPGTPEPEVLQTYPSHDRLTLRFHDIVEPKAGLVPPDLRHIEELLQFGHLSLGCTIEHVLIHCHMGVSRSTAAAAALLLQVHPEVADEAALAHISNIRPQARPNARMIALADELLGRRGRLIRALARMTEQSP
jgi:predicted protein tyrosine phosphatase